MSEDQSTVDGRAYDALVKEAGFLRDEVLQCIQHVRHLAVQSTYIAGFALPVVAGLIGADASRDNVSAGMPLNTEIVLIVVQFIFLGVSLTSLAFLRIYVGSFLQIFTFAKYFRQHLIPAIQKVANRPDIELFHWENWLKSHRAKKAAFIGDADLAAEPILIGLYTLVYGAGFITMSVRQNYLMIPSFVIGAVVMILLSMTFLKFLKILRDAASD